MSNSNFTSYDQVGKVEDVADIITNISPSKTPFQTMVGTEGIHNTVHQWQEDSLIDAGDNSAIEGADAPAAVQNATVLRSNTTQILTKTAKATGTANKVKTYGRAEELAYQLGMRSVELKRDLERILVGTGQTAVTGSAGVARKMAGYQAQIDASVTYTVNGTGGELNSNDVSPTAAPIREDVILTVAQALYTQGADPDTVMVKPSDALTVAGFQKQGRTVMVDNGDKKLVNVIDVYESPFGSLRLVMNRFQKTTDALVFESSMWKRLVLRNWFRQTLAITGDSTNVQVLGEFSLKHRNFKASGLITNLT